MSLDNTNIAPFRYESLNLTNTTQKSAVMSEAQPLAPGDGNRNGHHQDPCNPFSESSEKPVPAFKDESKQHETIHAKLKEQEECGTQYVICTDTSDLTHSIEPASKLGHTSRLPTISCRLPRPSSMLSRRSDSQSELSSFLIALPHGSQIMSFVQAPAIQITMSKRERVAPLAPQRVANRGARYRTVYISSAHILAVGRARSLGTSSLGQHR